MANKKPNSKPAKSSVATEEENIDDGSMFYDNTAGTIFSADSDAETGSNKEAKKQSKKSEKRKDSKKPAKNKKPLIIGASILLIAVALVGVYFVVDKKVPTQADDTSPTYPTDENGQQYATDLKGNKIDSEKDSNGNILVAGIETLIDHVPADIQTVQVTNEHGSFELHSETPTEVSTDANGQETVTTGATVYTLVGYEEATLESGKPDAIANDAAAVTTTNIVDITGKNPEEYGLTKPRATAKIKFKNGNERTVFVGNEAPGATGVYIKVNGDEAIYLVAVESVDAFLYKATALLDPAVTTAADTDENATASKVTISGSNFPKTLEFIPNDDETVPSAYYKMTAPTTGFANISNSTAVLGSLRSVTAEEVLAFNPSKADLKAQNVDLDAPYAELNATFGDTVIHLYASAPYTQEEVTRVNLYSPDTKMLYSISDTKVAWVTTTYEAMQYEHILKADIDYIKNIEVTAKGKAYSFDISKETKVDAEGNETIQTTVKHGDKAIDSSKFDIFFANLESAQVYSAKTGNVSGNADLTVKVTYNTDKPAETFTFYKGDAGKYNFSANGTTLVGDVFDTYVTSIIEDVALLAQNKNIDSI
ncbi:MAG: DUF4340 domain-containing protein [Acutalibacteraceae bacterium]|nr:DUF4340 domain-containing protein [Acutalibacteraceae bacterium]